MDAAAGNSFLSGDGTDEGITVDANGRVIVGDTTPTILSTSAQLSLQGGSGTAIEIGNTNTYKAYTIKVRNATSGAGAALSLSGADGGSGNTAGGAINVISGTGSGSGTGGDTNVLGGAGGGSGAGGAINLTTYSGSGSGTAVKGLHITNAQTVEISNGFLRYSQTPQTLTGAGAVDITSQITHFTDTGTNALTLADGANGQTKIICQIATAGGAGTLTPSNLAGGTNITFNAVGENAQLLFTNSSWHVIGISGATIA